MRQHIPRTDNGQPGAEPAEAAGAVSESTSASRAEGCEAIRPVLEQAVTQGGLPGILAEVRDGNRQWFGTAGVADTSQPPQHPRTA